MLVKAPPAGVASVLAAGRALIAQGRYAEAVAAFERAAALGPEEPLAHGGLGTALKALGRMDEARAALERAVEIAPGNGWLHRDLAQLKRFHAGDAQLAAMERLAATAGAWDRIPLHFALGQAYAELDWHENALHQFRLGNDLVARRKPYDERTVLWLFHRTASVFTRDFLAARAGVGHPSEAPIFILGMPRSGTTLVEQILSSHPAVAGAGEVAYLLLEAAAVGGNEPFTERIGLLKPEEWRALAIRYVGRLAARAPRAERITDKMPSNFFFVGLISLALPNARIVHVVRDPLDTCFSNYAHLFLDAPQTCDLAAIGRYYRAYAALMEHWRRVLPEGKLIEVQYERLVGNFPSEARRIVGQCGLPWDDACLDFAANPRAVSTLSALDVRESIHRNAIGRATPYRLFLRPLIDTLGAFDVRENAPNRLNCTFF